VATRGIAGGGSSGAPPHKPGSAGPPPKPPVASSSEPDAFGISYKPMRPRQHDPPPPTPAFEDEGQVGNPRMMTAWLETSECFFFFFFPF
jgi:hypothetical protein